MTLQVMSNSGPATLDISRSFAWNIEQYLQCSKTFEWWVGEGPLYWYKIEWKVPLCPPHDCEPGLSVCYITPPPCPCTPPPLPPCPPGECQICDQCEVWHVMATSVVDLCRRLNRECCNRNLFGKKVFKKVSKYGRPVLCCDVDRFILSNVPIIDDYSPVAFCSCECVSWVDPCDCGWIHVPCDDDVPFHPCTPPSVAAMLSTGILYGLPKVDVSIKPGFDLSEIQIMKPQVDAISTKCGILPSNLKMKHNLGRTSVLKEFLSRNRLSLPAEVDLVYSKTSNAWQKVVHLNGHDESWTVVLSWACSNDGDPGNYGWKADMHVSKQAGGKKQNTRVLAGFASHGMLDGKNMFGVNFNYNTKTDKVTARQPVIVKSKTMHDEIGLFRGNWMKDPYLTVSVSVDDKKG